MNSSYERYVADISDFPRIGPEREAELSALILADTNEEQVDAAVQELVQSNVFLVLHCLKEFRKFLSSPTVQITEMDLIAEGNIGLLNAARHFNAQYKGDGEHQTRSGIRFSTYACKSIKSRMRRALKRARFIHIPEHHFSYWTELGKARKEHGDDVQDEQLIEKLKVSPNVLGMLKQGERTRMFALEDMVADDDAGCWQELLPNEKAPCPDDVADTSLLRDFLFEEMERLPDRTRSMIMAMYFDESAPTLNEMARRYGVSSERCRQVCAQGLRKLRRQLEGRTQRIDPSLIPARVEFAA